MENLSSSARDNKLRTTGEQNLRRSGMECRGENQNSFGALQDRCIELEHCNRGLRTRICVLEEELSKFKQRWIKERLKTEQWMDYAQRIASSNGEALRSTNSSKPDAASLPSVLPVNDVGSQQEDIEVIDNRAIHRVVSSQSTMLEDPASPSCLLNEDDEDVPVIISERVLRRGRSGQSGSTVAIKCEPESPTVILSSDDSVDITRPALPPASSNLDVLMTNFQTPKTGRIRVYEDPEPSDLVKKSALHIDRSDRKTLQPINSNIVDKSNSKRVGNVKRKNDSNDQLVAAKIPRLIDEQLASDIDTAHDVEVTDQVCMSENAVAHDHDKGRPLPWSHSTYHTPAKSSLQSITPKTVIPNNVQRIRRPRRTISAKKDIPPLRSRPRSSLRLHDYLPNTGFVGQPLQILDPLFTPEQRMCPSTCQRAQCCGDKVRNLFAKIGKHRSKKTDEKVCEEYFGPDWQNILAQLPEHRETVILQVHAMSYQRMTGQTVRCGIQTNSPTRNWRARMPNTQEREEDRVYAKEMDQRKLLERWIEAMRPNGRWRFADEVMNRG